MSPSPASSWLSPCASAARTLAAAATRRRGAAGRAPRAPHRSAHPTPGEPLESRRLFSAALVTASPAALPGLAADDSSAVTVPLVPAAQTLALSSGVHSYPTLADATVTMTGRTELHVTAAADPIPNSTIHLNSPDAWFWLDSVKPSVVNSTYLRQVRVNGAAAVHGANVRVVQYALGAVVIPHAPSYQPLQAFAGPNFTGAARSFAQYTYHNTDAALAPLRRDISSLRLKRGYMATVATEPDGGGFSKVYVAQDHDLDVGILPPEFDNAVRFVRVFPWRWVSKKGASDLSPGTLDAAWHYNWNNDRNSTLDHEYVPIRQQRWWPGLPTNKPDSTHLLGFNEPDNPVEDAYQTLDNGSVDTAIAVWPELLSTGLRVGSPAVTDGGKAWLYEFMDKAIAANLRVDYIAIHNYQAGHTGSSLYNWLKDVYDRYHLPIWLTEFNNGANWTGGADPTYEQNAQKIGEFIEMMDNTPWVERYSVYSRVEAVREMTYADGSLTPAGVVYRNNASPVGYVQEPVPSTNTAGRSAAQFPLDGHTLDVSGHGNHAQAVGAPAYVPGPRGQAIDLDGASGFVRLPENVARGNAFSFAAWVNWDGGANWQRVFDFGTGTSSYLFLTPRSGSGTLRFAIRNGGAEQIVQTAAALPTGRWTHVALTLGGGAARLYLNGTLAATNAAVTIRPGDFDPTLNYLGESQFAADPLFNGRLDDVLVTDYALTGAQVAGLMADAAPRFASDTISLLTRRADFGRASLTGAATDPDAGDAVTYRKTNGPAWLGVAPDGTLTGTPPASALKAEVVVTATDSFGASDSAVLTVRFPEPLAWYRADETSGAVLADSSGRNNAASLAGAYGFVPGPRGNALSLAGGHATLPAGIVSAAADLTVATWLKLDALDTWSRVFDFGTGTGAWMFLTPQAGTTNRPAFSISTSGGAGQRIDANTSIPVGAWTHVAVTLSGRTGTLYLNGVAVGSNAAMTLGPSDLGHTDRNYVGRSQYAADPPLRGSVDDFRVYGRALSPSEVRDLAAPVSNGPRVAGVAVDSSGWSDAFRAAAGRTAAGVLLPGYALPDGGRQADVLPWQGLDRVSVAFDEPVEVATLRTPGVLSLAGGDAPPPALAFVGYDAATRVATWALPAGASVPAGRWRLVLADGVTDVLGNPLDGQWQTGADAFPSGDDAPGGAFAYAFGVLPGDVNGDGRVTARDVARLRASLLSSARFPDHPSRPWSPASDLTGDGRVTLADLSLLRRAFGTSLPATALLGGEA